MLVIMTILTVRQTKDRWNFRVPHLVLTKTHSRAIAPVKIPKWSLSALSLMRVILKVKNRIPMIPISPRKQIVCLMMIGMSNIIIERKWN